MSSSSPQRRHPWQRSFVVSAAALVSLVMLVPSCSGGDGSTEVSSDLPRDPGATTPSTVVPSTVAPSARDPLSSPAPAESPPGGRADEATTAPVTPSGPRSVQAGGPVSPSDPARVVVPAISVDAHLVPVGLNPDQSMETPDFGVAGWYTEGPRPGEQGPAVIAAHVDSHNGPDVFFRLRELSPGDEVQVYRHDGSVTRFVVERSEQTPKEALPADRIWNDTDETVLRLVTCGGTFDRSTRSYRDNLIVYANAA